ncbi:MAG: hypothetical protein KC636_25810 [Myxococcales bacterium]|nr:hypothetical protein [Myxococcales bacterium]
MRSAALPCLAALLVLAPACSNEKKDTTSETSGSWLVGDDGAMYRIAASAGPELYPLDEDRDLLAIACKGLDRAWVVGEDGVLLSTADGGARWETHAVDVDETLRDVTATAGAVVLAVGDGGALLRSEDLGATWTRPPTTAVDWTGVAADEAGERAFLAGADGSIWRHEPDAPLTRVRAPGPALSDISVTPAGDAIAAVGQGGWLLTSSDGGARWEIVAPPTDRDLNAVVIAHDGATIIAVGEAGVTVHLRAGAAIVHEHLDPALHLRALHVSADGHGVAVGDAGAVLVSHDAGERWIIEDLGLVDTLRGVDELEGVGHL